MSEIETIEDDSTMIGRNTDVERIGEQGISYLDIRVRIDAGGSH
jgi:hypothetical protein